MAKRTLDFALLIGSLVSPFTAGAATIVARSGEIEGEVAGTVILHRTEEGDARRTTFFTVVGADIERIDEQGIQLRKGSEVGAGVALDEARTTELAEVLAVWFADPPRTGEGGPWMRKTSGGALITTADGGVNMPLRCAIAGEFRGTQLLAAIEVTTATGPISIPIDDLPDYRLPPPSAPPPPAVAAVRVEEEQDEYDEDPREERRRRQRERAERKIERQIAQEEKQIELKEAWLADRRVLFNLGANLAVLIGESGESVLVGAEAALGLRKKFTSSFVVQGRVALGGGGVGGGPSTGDSPFEKGMITVSHDLTIRIGFGGSFYLGLGTQARLFHAFAGAPQQIGNITVEDSNLTSILGGGVLELGWVIGSRRNVDLGLRANGGLVLHSFSTTEDDSEDGVVDVVIDHPAFYFGGSFVFAWGLETRSN